MHVTFKGSCMVQTTSWSPCSRTCGFGISDRVTNDNKDCELQKQTRLCNLRPCSAVQRKTTSVSLKPITLAFNFYQSLCLFQRKRCRKNLRHNKRVRFSLSGCLSNTTYRPKYCGTCANKCCDPQSAKTVPITFTCKDNVNATSSFSRDMMMIKKCHCHECFQGNDIFSAVYTGLDGDMFQGQT